MGNLRKIKNNITDKQKLIHTYITIIIDHNRGITLTYYEIKNLIKLNFNFEVTIDDIKLYFEPNACESSMDKQLQYKNLGIKYD